MDFTVKFQCEKVKSDESLPPTFCDDCRSTKKTIYWCVLCNGDAELCIFCLIMHMIQKHSVDVLTYEERLWNNKISLFHSTLATKMSTPLEIIPNEVVRMILEHLPEKTRISLRCLNWTFFRLVTSFGVTRMTKNNFLASVNEYDKFMMLFYGFCLYSNTIEGTMRLKEDLRSHIESHKQIIKFDKKFKKFLEMSYGINLKDYL